MMRYDDLFKPIHTDSLTLRTDTHRLTWQTVRTIPNSIARAVTAKLDRMKAENEAVRRFPKSELDRIFREIEREETITRQLAAGAARYAVERVVDDLARRHAAYVARRRADVALSFPDAMNGISPDGMLTFHHLTETLRPTIAQAGAAELRRLYADAIETKDARGRIVATLVEERVDHGGIAETEDDLPIIRELSDQIEGIRDLRVEPHAELTTIGEIITEARKAIARAEIAHVYPANVAHDPKAKAAAERESEAYEAEAAAR